MSYDSLLSPSLAKALYNCQIRDIEKYTTIDPSGKETVIQGKYFVVDSVEVLSKHDPPASNHIIRTHLAASSSSHFNDAVPSLVKFS